jgi:hypothetical protein
MEMVVDHAESESSGRRYKFRLHLEVPFADVATWNAIKSDMDKKNFPGAADRIVANAPSGGNSTEKAIANQTIRAALNRPTGS